MESESVRKLFERRQFSETERAEMRELYAQTEALAQRLVRTIPPCGSRDEAVYCLKMSLAHVETAVALNPKCDKQVSMTFNGCGEEIAAKTPTEKDFATRCEQAYPAHARR